MSTDKTRCASADDVELSELLVTLPSTKSRLLIELVNGLEVSRDHLNVQRARDGSFVSRALDALSGAGRKRQTQIAQRQQGAIDGLIAVANDLAQGLTGSNLAIGRVAERVTFLERSLGQVAHHLADAQRALKALDESIGSQLLRINAELGQLDLRASATEELNRVLSDWRAGRYDGFAPAGRCYAALHELYWGPFGEFWRRHPQDAASQRLLRTLENELSLLLREARGPGRHGLEEWLELPSDQTTARYRLHAEALRFLGRDAQAQRQPMSHACTHWPMTAADLPLEVPLLCDASRLAGLLQRECFHADNGGLVA